jgi:hypothetical protein
MVTPMKQLKAGTVIEVYGLPVRLLADVDVETNDANWPTIEARHAEATDGSTPDQPRPDGSYGYPVDDRL